MNTDQNQTPVANFIQKSFQILQKKQYESIIHWMTNGREFAIREIDEFQGQILPKFFRHRNINSFIRQLNMYGFHKSRKDPSKNIFSHPFFLRGQPQILHLVKRKIKIDQKLEDQMKIVTDSLICKKPINGSIQSEQLISKISLTSTPKLKDNKFQKVEKDLVPAKTQTGTIGSLAFMSLRSFGLAIQISPFKGLMEKSCVMDSNPQMYLKMRENTSVCHGQQIPQHDEDIVSIADQIEEERRVFKNRKSGVCILQTCNLLSDFEFK